MLGALVIGGIVWRVVRVKPWDPVLVDRMGSLCVAVTDPMTQCIYISTNLYGDFLDRVLLHEATHAAMITYGMNVPCCNEIQMEEWACNLIANRGREILQAVDQLMPRSVGSALRTWHGIIQQ